MVESVAIFDRGVLKLVSTTICVVVMVLVVIVVLSVSPGRSAC